MPNNSVTNAADDAARRIQKINLIQSGKALNQSERAIAEKFQQAHYSTRWLDVITNSHIPVPSVNDKKAYNVFLYSVYVHLLSLGVVESSNEGNCFAVIPKESRENNETYTLNFNNEESETIKSGLSTSSPYHYFASIHKSNALETANSVSNASIIDSEKPKPDDNNFNPQDSTIEIHDASGELLGRIVDHGESLNPIVFASDKVAALETMRHAQLKGWSSVNLTGSDEFVQECMKYCVENNITPIITQDKQQKMLDSTVKKQKLKKKGLKM